MLPFVLYIKKLQLILEAFPVHAILFIEQKVKLKN